jgi:peptidoglycan/LPS O-acetylase OafA/YrhL
MTLTMRDSLALKGLAICAIALHNHFHLLGYPKENEFDFDSNRFFLFLSQLADPAAALPAVPSYLGHFGVQVFIFISAYGLTVKHSPPRGADFLVRRVVRIYPAFLLAICVWLLMTGLPDGLMGPVRMLRQHGSALVLTLLGTQNLVPGQGLPPVGPWWFVPFIMQLYVLWPAFWSFARWGGLGGLAALSAGSMALTLWLNDTLVERLSLNLLETPFGHIPEISLGVACARFAWKPTGVWAGLSAGVWLAANLYKAIWILSFPAALIVALWVYRKCGAHLAAGPVFTWLGQRSMALFFVNGFVRYPFLRVSEGSPAGAVIVLGAASVLASVAVADVLTRIVARWTPPKQVLP